MVPRLSGLLENIRHLILVRCQIQKVGGAYDREKTLTDVLVWLSELIVATFTGRDDRNAYRATVLHPRWQRRLSIRRHILVTMT
jgi:hypothetical protein